MKNRSRDEPGSTKKCNKFNFRLFFLNISFSFGFGGSAAHSTILQIETVIRNRRRVLREFQYAPASHRFSATHHGNHSIGTDRVRAMTGNCRAASCFPRFFVILCRINKLFFKLNV